MEIRITYKGTLKGTKGIWCGFKPKDIKVDKEILVLYPEEGKALVKEGNILEGPVILESEDDQNLYTEIELPKEELEEVQ